MASIHANGHGVRHAVARAVATANLEPSEAVFRVKRARVDLDREGRVARAEVSIEIEVARPLSEWSPAERVGLVNPDGAHPLMVWLPGDPAAGVEPFFMDILAVSWNRWLKRNEGTLPPGIDLFCPVTVADHAAAQAFAAAQGKQLPTLGQWRAAWGRAELPWGEVPDPSCGRVGRPRYDELPEGGLHPPGPGGLFDLGGWLWQWLDDGRLVGGGAASQWPVEGEPRQWPVGVRLVSPA